jgi:hypothetical protein
MQNPVGPKTDQYSDGEVLASKALLDPHEQGDGVVGLEAEFGDEADGEQDLDVGQLADGPDGLIDGHGVEFVFVENFVVLQPKDVSNRCVCKKILRWI